MKISDLIRHLESYRETDGDVEVAWLGCHSWGGELEQTDVDLDMQEWEHHEDDEGPFPKVLTIGTTSPRLLDRGPVWPAALPSPQLIGGWLDPANPEVAYRLPAQPLVQFGEAGGRRIRQPLEEFARWVVSLDDPDPESAGFQDRRTVGLSQIVDRARQALGEES